MLTHRDMAQRALPLPACVIPLRPIPPALHPQDSAEEQHAALIDTAEALCAQRRMVERIGAAQPGHSVQAAYAEIALLLRRAVDVACVALRQIEGDEG